MSDLINGQTPVPEADEDLAALLEEGEGTEGQEAEPEIEWKGQKLKASKEVKGAWDEWQGDYTRKTMGIAEKEKELAGRQTQLQEAAEVQRTFIREFGKIENLDAQITEFQKVTPEQWVAARAQDKDAADQALFQFNMLKGQRAEMAQSLAGKIQEFQNKSQMSAKERRDAAEREIALRVKDYTSDTRGNLIKFAAETYGFNTGELENHPMLHDPRVVHALHDVFTIKTALAKAKAARAKQVQETEQATIIPIAPGKTRAPASPEPRDTDSPDVWRKKFRALQNKGSRRR